MALALPSFGHPRPRAPGRIVAFKLDGDARLAPAAKADPIVLTKEALSAAAVAQGARVFAANCSACHASGAMSAGVVPDLRRSGAVADPAAWRSVVMDGALADAGMISFKGKISAEEAESARLYVQSQARDQARREAGAPR